MSPTLHVRLSDTELCFARYSACPEPDFSFVCHHIRPQASLTVNLREAEATLDILKQPTERVHVAVTGGVTPVPLAEFQEEDCETIYDYCYNKLQPRRVFYDTVPSANIVLVFSLEESTCRALEDCFGEVRYGSALTPVLDKFTVKALSTTPSRRMFVYSHDGRITVAAFDEARLIMINSYEVHAVTDTAYYVFGVASRLNLDLSQTPFYVAGPTEGRDTIVEEMRRYAARVYPISPTGDFNRHPVSTQPEVPYDLMCELLK